MKYLNKFRYFFKYLKKDEKIIYILFVIVSIFSIISFGVWGLLFIPVMAAIAYTYHNVDIISKYINKKIRKRKSDIMEKKKKKNETKSEIENELEKKKTKKKIILKKKKEKSENIIEDNESDDIIKDEIKNEMIKDNEDVLVVKKKTSKKNAKVVKKKKDNKKPKRALWKILLTGFIVLCILGIISVAGFILYIVMTTEPFDPNALITQEQTVVYDKDGNILATLGIQKRENATYSELPEVLVDAIIATEDSRFFQHNGVDLPRFFKASVGQILGNSDAGGASTLTMQVAKNNLTSTESQGIEGIIRKFKDVYLSVFYIEKQYTKEQIIEFYVNDNCLGGRIYGVKEASKYYFGKTVSELSLPEASLLAGLFQSPNGLNPYSNPEGATERRNTVLNLMVRHGYITKEEAELAKAVSVEGLLVEQGEEEDYAGYIDTVVAEITEKTGDDPYKVPMKIYTYMDKDIQDGINDVLSGEAHDWDNDVVQAGISVVDVNTGSIVAIGAGHNRKAGDWNYATQATRHIGSTAKPLFDYAPGFEYNNFSTYTLFYDEPWEYTDGPEIGNWDGNFEGLITLRRALSVSRNIPALKAFQQVNKKNIVEFVTNLGIEAEIEGNSLHEAHALGAFEPGATTLQMASAYAAFANGGYYIEPSSVEKIEYRSTGEIVEFNYNKERVMSEETAYLMNNVLQYAVEYGFNGGARVYGSTVAAKTGTSNLDDKTIEDLGIPYGSVNDLWTVAYTPEYSIALWYGYEKVSSEYYLGGASAPKDAVMKSVMKYIPKTTKKFEKPDTVVSSQVEMGSWPAQLPSEYTPSDLIVTEYFKKGTQPTEVSNRFNKLNDVTNLESEVNGRTITLSWDFKVPEVTTETYLTNYFSQSVFGNGTNNLVQERLDYNDNTLGGLGFGIYIEHEDGELEEIGFTTENNFTYKVPSIYNSRNITLVVKAEYKSFNANASNGVSEALTITGNGNEGDTVVTKLTADIGNSIVTPKVGEYIEEDIKVMYEGLDITSKASISYELFKGIDQSVLLETTTNKITLENKVKSLEAGTYTIKYTITYLGESIPKIRTVNITN